MKRGDFYVKERHPVVEDASLVPSFLEGVDGSFHIHSIKRNNTVKGHPVQRIQQN